MDAAPRHRSRLSRGRRTAARFVACGATKISFQCRWSTRPASCICIDKLKVASVTVENRSLMPNDYATRLSPAEITNIVAYLRMQQGRDLSKTVAQPIAGGVTYERLLKAKAEPHNWLMYWGDYHGTHYSPLNQITPNNVKRLKAAWSFPILGGNSVLEGTPLVVDGIMYTTGSGNPATVTAIDARSGRQIWRWTRQQKTVNPYEINPFARGVAILGNRMFVGTLDGVLVALDARTGQPLWEVPVVDTMEGSSITSPPLVLKDMVITGMTGGEYATRGLLDAYDAATGKRRWRFYTIPAPGEFGNDTWKGDSWKTGGGPTWLTGSYDAGPEPRLLGRWKSGAGVRSDRARRNGQPVHQLRRRARCRHRENEVALSIHAR